MPPKASSTLGDYTRCSRRFQRLYSRRFSRQNGDCIVAENCDYGRRK